MGKIMYKDIPFTGAIKTDHIELTQLQYDALSTAEKNDPDKVYFIRDGVPISSNTMIQTISYSAQITWYSTSNPFCVVDTDITLEGWIPIDLTYVTIGTGSSYIYASQAGIVKNGNNYSAHGYFRMAGSTPSTTTQNTVNWTVTYIKNAPMVVPMADYVVEHSTENGWEYIKWDSGRFEMWKVYSGAPATGTHYATSNGFYGYRVQDIYFPSGCKPIDTNYHVSDTWIVDSGFSMSAGTVNSKSTEKFTVFCLASSGSQTTVNVNLYVTGRWK